MLDNRIINELAEKLSSIIPEGARALKSDIDSNIRAILESSLRQMHLVSREEFDTQSALLTRTIEKLEQIEQQVKELESNI